MANDTTVNSKYKKAATSREKETLKILENACQIFLQTTLYKTVI